jgi:hypothetical protein
LADIHGFLALGCVVDWRAWGGERCEALTLTAIHGGTGFGAGRTWEPFCLAGGNQLAEKEIDRLWGIPGGFPGQVPVIIQMEDGCWRRGCIFGRAKLYKLMLLPGFGWWRDSHFRVDAVQDQLLTPADLKLPPVCTKSSRHLSKSPAEAFRH